jgi:hypothetical protein
VAPTAAAVLALLRLETVEGLAGVVMAVVGMVEAGMVEAGSEAAISAGLAGAVMAAVGMVEADSEEVDLVEARTAPEAERHSQAEPVRPLPRQALLAHRVRAISRAAT